MSIEAMKQALEALEKCEEMRRQFSAWDIDPPLHHVQESHDLCGPAITSLRQAIAEAEKQEPVAWMVYTQDGKSVYVTDNPTDIQEGQRALPLYTHPQPKAEQKPLLLSQKHREGYWCADLTCKKCYSADFRFKHTNTGNMAVGLTMPQCVCQWQSTQEKSRIETVPAQGTLLPKREWVGLTDEEVEEDSVFFTESEGFKHGAYWAEAKLKEKNT